ncbi:MAG: undecaprenyldiphospho-muramoylpentapeptide beta-N-acetylglucosaminyltransferase [Acidimicrobiales bacterium]|nr:undecaprenyldiphospho-muramoylpentapeptide beta-N-acetylglucosaminyltransferase [Acidimicrobiales bacterium]
MQAAASSFAALDRDATDHSEDAAPRRPWIVVAGGGTVGHVSPGVAIAEALVRRGCPRGAIHFVGSRRGVEATRVPNAGFSLTLLPGRGIQRKLTVQNIGAVTGLLAAFAAAFWVLLRRRPKIVLSLGGYASAPCGLAAAVLRIPIVVAEQNAIPGAANRLVGRAAKACAVSFEHTDLPRAVLTGNPVRAEMLSVERRLDRAEARRLLGVPEGRTLLLAYGGSLGARTVNRAVWGALERWVDRDDLAVRHVIGDRGWAERPAEIPAGALHYDPVIYEEHMPQGLRAADVVLSRAGASTVFELAAVGVGSILVPLPIATEDHQTANARALERVGAAVVIADRDLTPQRLVEELDRLLTEDGRLTEMAAAARTVGRPDAADRVADLLVRHARGPWPGDAPTEEEAR